MDGKTDRHNYQENDVVNYVFNLMDVSFFGSVSSDSATTIGNHACFALTTLLLYTLSTAVSTQTAYQVLISVVIFTVLSPWTEGRTCRWLSGWVDCIRTGRRADGWADRPGGLRDRGSIVCSHGRKTTVSSDSADSRNWRWKDGGHVGGPMAGRGRWDVGHPWKSVPGQNRVRGDSSSFTHFLPLTIGQLASPGSTTMFAALSLSLCCSGWYRCSISSCCYLCCSCYRCSCSCCSCCRHCCYIYYTILTLFHFC